MALPIYEPSSIMHTINLLLYWSPCKITRSALSTASSGIGSDKYPHTQSSRITLTSRCFAGATFESKTKRYQSAPWCSYTFWFILVVNTRHLSMRNKLRLQIKLVSPSTFSNVEDCFLLHPRSLPPHKLSHFYIAMVERFFSELIWFRK